MRNGRPRTSRDWKLALRRMREARQRQQLQAAAVADHRLINTIRVTLGMDPLYTRAA